MKTVRIFTGLMILALLLALAPSTFAQELTFGLSPEDWAELQAAAAATAAATSGQYLFTLDATINAEGEAVELDFNGSGVFETADPANPVFSLDLDGQVTATGETTPIDAQVRVINGALYFNSSLLGMPQWILATPEDLGMFTAGLPIDPAALAAGDLSQLEGMEGMEGAGDFFSLLAANNLTDFVTITRDAERFTTNVDVQGLVSSPEFQDAIVQQAIASGDMDMTEEELRQQLAQLPTALQGTTFALDQYVTDGMVTRIVLNAAINADPSVLGEEGEIVNMALSLDASVSGLGQDYDVDVPEETILLSELFGGAMEGAG